MPGFALSLAALADLELIADRLESERPDSLESVLDSLERACGILGRYPELGTRRPELGTDTRSHVAGSYVIIYRSVAPAERLGVEILRFIHGRQDLHRALNHPGSVRERLYDWNDIQAIGERSELTNPESDALLALQTWPV